MSIEKAREYFRQFGIEDRIQEFNVSSATVELAAKAVGTAPERISKTLSFKVGDGCILVLCAGDARIDNKKFKAQFGTNPGRGAGTCRPPCWRCLPFRNKPGS